MIPHRIATRLSLRKPTQEIYFNAYISRVTYAPNLIIQNIATGGKGTGAITYSVSSYGDDVDAVTIDSNNGKVTILSTGTVLIVAEKAADRNYKLDSATYWLPIVSDGSAFTFAQTSITIPYEQDKKISNIATSNRPGTVTYSISDTAVATIDANTGEVTLKDLGTAKVTANKLTNLNYRVFTHYILNVYALQPQTGFGFTTHSVTIGYKAGAKTRSIASGGQSTGAVTYSVSSGDVDAVTIDANNGEVTILSTGTVVITATKAGDTVYAPAYSTYLLTIAKEFITFGIKEMQFDWGKNAVTAGKIYQLEVDYNKGGGSVNAYDLESDGFSLTPKSDSKKINQTHALAKIASLHHFIPKVNGLSFRLYECTTSLCDSNPIVTSNITNKQLSEMIGYIKASNTGDNDQFGKSVSLSADGMTLVIGAPLEDSNAKIVNTQLVGSQANNSAKDSGAVYIFARESDDTWSQQAYIKAHNAGAGDQFGYAVSLNEDGTRLAVGAPFEDGGSGYGEDSGAVYVYVKDKIFGWIRQAYLKGHTSNSKGNQLGSSVSLSGKSGQGHTLAAGAPNRRNSATKTKSGGVHIYYRPPPSRLHTNPPWEDQDYITGIPEGKDREEKDALFGSAVALAKDGRMLAVSAPNGDNEGKGAGKGKGTAYTFKRARVLVDGAYKYQWSQTYEFKAADADSGDLFGASLSFRNQDENTRSDFSNNLILAIGAPNEDNSAKGTRRWLHNGYRNHSDNNESENSGAVYIFNYNQKDLLHCRLVTGTVEEAKDGAKTCRDGKGKTHSTTIDTQYYTTYYESVLDWSPTHLIKASNTGAGDNFGFSVNLNSDTLAVGAIGESGGSIGINGADNDDVSKSGAAYTFTLNSGVWKEQAYVKANNAGKNDNFGHSVFLSKDTNTLVVGAPLEKSDSTGIGGQDNDNTSNAGAVYLY